VHKWSLLCGNFTILFNNLSDIFLCNIYACIPDRFV
jgi:hypothetical protein